MGKVNEKDLDLQTLAEGIVNQEEWAISVAVDIAYQKARDLASLLMRRHGAGHDWMGAEGIALKALHDYEKALRKDFKKYYAGYELRV